MQFVLEVTHNLQLESHLLNIPNALSDSKYPSISESMHSFVPSIL